mmetsp:Transcript_30781/g.100198  ORF Transcript_30781/g.100198 Transcript_30781/m.100198 type:complete len:271 (-) Transcript_30781:1459-2271(-)
MHLRTISDGDGDGAHDCDAELSRDAFGCAERRVKHGCDVVRSKRKHEHIAREAVREHDVEEDDDGDADERQKLLADEAHEHSAQDGPDREGDNPDSSLGPELDEQPDCVRHILERVDAENRLERVRRLHDATSNCAREKESLRIGRVELYSQRFAIANRAHHHGVINCQHFDDGAEQRRAVDQRLVLISVFIVMIRGFVAVVLVCKALACGRYEGGEDGHQKGSEETLESSAPELQPLLLAHRIRLNSDGLCHFRCGRVMLRMQSIPCRV